MIEDAIKKYIGEARGSLEERFSKHLAIENCLAAVELLADQVSSLNKRLNVISEGLLNLKSKVLPEKYDGQ